MRQTPNPVASYQVGYVKNGIDILLAPFDPVLLGVALQIDVGGKAVKTAVVNGKLRRGERREIAKILILAIESGELLKEGAFYPDALSRIITRKSFDAYKETINAEKTNKN